MRRWVFLASLAVVGTLLLLYLDGNAAAPPPPNNNELYVIVKARLYEVDKSFHKKLARAKWLSKADLEELETKPQPDNKLFARLEKQKAVLTSKEVKFVPGKEALLLTTTKSINHLPSPEQLRRGNRAPQPIDEGCTLRVRLTLSADRRFVYARFLEKGLEIEGVEQVTIVADDQGNEALGEIVSVKESTVSYARYVPDGGSILLPLHYRPVGVRKKGRWLVAEIEPRIIIVEEERERQRDLGPVRATSPRGATAARTERRCTPP